MIDAGALSEIQRRVLADIRAGHIVPVRHAYTAGALERRGLVSRASRYKPWRATAAGMAIDMGTER